MAVGVYMRVRSNSQKVGSRRREVARFPSANGMTVERGYIDEGVTGASGTGRTSPARGPSRTWTHTTDPMQ